VRFKRIWFKSPKSIEANLEGCRFASHTKFHSKIMLTFSITRVASLRGIGKPYKFLVKNGFTPTTATKLANGDVEYLRIEYLEKLANLLNATPNDFFEWVPNSRSEDKADHPLAAIKKSELVDLTSALRGLSMDKLKEVEALLGSMK